MSISGLQEGACYRFRYALFQVQAEVRGSQLLIKTSTKTEIVPLDSLRYLYAPIIRAESYRELVLAYEEGGRLKRARVFSNKGEAPFEQLLESLKELLPHGDLSSLPAHEAYERLGSRELSWVAIPALMIAGIAFVALLASPYLIHGLEGPPVELTLAELERAEPRAEMSASTHLIVSGRLDLNYMIQGQERERGYQLIAPLYSSASSDAARAARPAALVKLSGLGALKLDELSAQRRFQGLERSLLWEGLTVQERKRLTERGLDLSAEPLLLELGVSPTDDLSLYLSVLSLMSLLTFAVWRALKPVA